MKMLLLLLIALVILSGCASRPTAVKVDIKTECCEQCSYGASKDPTGADISGKLCSSYKNLKKFDESGSPTSENVLTSECLSYFEKFNTKVVDCR